MKNKADLKPEESLMISEICGRQLPPSLVHAHKQTNN